MADSDITPMPVSKCHSCEEFSTMKLTEEKKDLTICKSNSVPQIEALSQSAKEPGVDPEKSNLSAEGKPMEKDIQEDPSDDPDKVLCDFCLEQKVAATKTCLTCMISYCEMHLKPHLTNVKLHTHQIVDPVNDTNLRTCSIHQKPLDWFCQEDLICVCEDCAEGKHSAHTKISCAEAKKDIEVEVQQLVAEYDWKRTSAEHAIIKLETNTKSIQNSVTEARKAINVQFDELQDAVKSARSKVLDFLEQREKASLNQADGIKTYLEQKCNELKKSKAKVEGIASRRNASNFLQEYCEFKKTKADDTLPSVYIGLKDKLSGIQKVVAESTEKIIQTLQTSYTESLQDFAKEENLGIKTMVSAIVPPNHRIGAPEPTTRNDFLKYKSNVTLDPDTAHRFLRLQQDNRKVTNSAPWQHPYPDHPERFEHFRQVLSEESFYLGRHYFEVQFKGEVIHVGVTYKCIDRKGAESNSSITGNDFSWTLKWNGKEFSVWHSDVETPLKSEKTSRVGVYVNYQSGTVAFYGVTSTMTRLHQFEAKFAEPLYAAIWLPKKENSVTIISPDEMLLPVVTSPSPVETKTEPIYSESTSTVSSRTEVLVNGTIQTVTVETSSVKKSIDCTISESSLLTTITSPDPIAELAAAKLTTV
ncbi:tripartite motif-containing protein 16 [Pelobates fuscus]|uniref:tripartite motif-containing protein 16 n=1 Tax=Pelobates fuscus TaxID=191477 RepID=UPI002FE4BF5A